MEFLLVTLVQILHAFDSIVSTVVLDRSISLALLIPLLGIGSWLLYQERDYIGLAVASVLGIAGILDHPFAVLAIASMVVWLRLRFRRGGMYRPISLLPVVTGVMSGVIAPSLFLIVTGMVYWCMRVESWRVRA